MKLNQLVTFLAVVEHKSIRGAARALDVTQPGITKTMHDLEDDLGVQLLTRLSGGVDLTEYGELLKVRAGFLLNEVRRTRESLHYLRDKNVGNLVIGASATAAHTLLPGALKKLMDQSPGIDVTVREGSLRMFGPLLRDGTLDFAIVNMVSDFQDDEFDIIPLCSYETVFGMRRSFTWTGPLHLAQLLELPWILPGLTGGTSGNQMLEDLLKANKLDLPKRVVNCDAMATAMGMMGSADMVGFFSKPLADQEFERMGLIQLPIVEKTPWGTVSIVSNKGAPLSLLAQKMVALLKQSAPSFPSFSSFNS